MATKKQKQIMMAMYPVKSLDITTYMVDNKVNVPLDIFSYLKNNRLIDPIDVDSNEYILSPKGVDGAISAFKEVNPLGQKYIVVPYKVLRNDIIVKEGEETISMTVGGCDYLYSLGGIEVGDIIVLCPDREEELKFKCENIGFSFQETQILTVDPLMSIENNI